MSDDDDMSEISTSSLADRPAYYKPFTRETLERIKERMRKEKVKKESSQVNEMKLQKVKGKTAQPKRREKQKEITKPDPKLEQGASLPVRLSYYFTEDFANVPLVDLDPFYANIPSFVVVTKRKDIFRFSATDAMYCLSPFNPTRRLAIATLTHGLFSLIIFTTILCNCYVMLLPSSSFTESCEVVFAAIYTLESVVKLIARGFIMEKFTYLRDAWNWLDFMILITAYMTMGTDLGSLAVLRTCRVFRALKTLAVVPGLKTVLGAVVESVKNLRDMIIFMVFALSVFSLVGLQLYKGVLTRKCIRDFPDDGSVGIERDINWHQWNLNDTNWFPNFICGNSWGSGICPLENFTCMQGYGPNPDYGYTSFDNFGHAYLTSFRLITLDSWESLYSHLLGSAGSVHILFFIFVLFLGSYYLVNLVLAIVAISYDELQKAAEEEAMADQAELKTIEAEEAARAEVMASRAAKQSRSHIPEHPKTASNLKSYDPIGQAPPGREQVVTKEIIPKTGARNLSGTERARTLSEGPVSASVKDRGKQSLVRRDPYSNIELEIIGFNIGESPDLTVLPEVSVRARGISVSANPSEPDSFKKRVKGWLVLACSTCLDYFCIWEFGFPWNTFQRIATLIVCDAFTDLFITMIVVLNILFMSMDHHGIEEKPVMMAVLATANEFFTAVFTLEFVLKVISMSPYSYFQVRWNCFDFMIVLFSLVEMVFEGFGIQLRVFKLAKSWPALNAILANLGKTVVALSNLVLVLLIAIFIFAVMGMQLFAQNYLDKTHFFPDGELPRWNFTDFEHSFLVVFRILCGQWIESMWNCMLVNGGVCVPFFLVSLTVGNFVLFNLFISLLLNSFRVGGPSPSTDEEPNKLLEAFERIGRFFNWAMARLRQNVLLWTSLIVRRQNRIDPAGMDTEADVRAAAVAPRRKPRLRKTVVHWKIKKKRMRTKWHSAIKDKKKAPGPSHHGTLRPKSRRQPGISDPRRAVYGSDSEWLDVIDEYGDRDDVQRPVSNMTPSACMPPGFFKIFPIFDVEGTRFGVCWSNLRLKTFRLIDNKYFDRAVLLTILLSSVGLALEDVHLPGNPYLTDILFYADHGFTLLFYLEMLIKWVGVGFVAYFQNGWCWLDFVIVMTHGARFVVGHAGFGRISALDTMRILRILRPLRYLARMQGMRPVFNGLIGALPSILNVLLVCLLFWFLFAMMGIQLFKGKFYRCFDPKDYSILDHLIIRNKSECLAYNHTWENSALNFDHVGTAYLCLLQVATFRAWDGIITDAVDSREIDDQPYREASFVMYAYFVIFIIFGSFFAFNMFVGTIIDSCNAQKRKAECCLEKLMTEEQKQYAAAWQKMRNRKPTKSIPKPRWKPQLILFNFCTNAKFDMVIMLLIGLNMILMMMDHYPMSQEWEDILGIFNAIFVALFTAECSIKIFAFRYHFFAQPWNLFEMLVVLLSVVDLVWKDSVKIYFLNPALFRVARVAKIDRVLRQARGTKGIRTLLITLARSTPALLHICLLFFVVISIFSVLGMALFKDVRPSGELDLVHNFQAFSNSFNLLFKISTGAGWDTALDGIAGDEDCDEPDAEYGKSGNCGNTVIGLAFLLLYYVMSYLIIINMYAAIILENYSSATVEVQEGLTDNDYDMFYEIWGQFDQEGCQFIAYSQLSDFLSVLEAPWKMVKPYKYKIISMDIPICTGERVHCVDILKALTKDFFVRKGNLGELPTEMEFQSYTHRPGYKTISSTLWRQREENCARLLQKAWRLKKNSSVGLPSGQEVGGSS